MDRILAIQVKQIGDAVLTLPALRILRRAYPEARITFAVSPLAAQLGPCFPCVDRVVGIDPRWVDWQMWRHIGGPCYDLSLDFSGTDRGQFLSVLSGAPLRLGYRKHSEIPFRSKVYSYHSDAELRDSHTIDYFSSLLSGIDIDTVGVEEPLAITIPTDVRGAVTAKLREEFSSLTEPGPEGRLPGAANRRFAIVHAGTARAEKYWVAERWARVIEHMVQSDMAVVLTGGVGDDERAHIDAILASLEPEARERTVDLVGRLSLLESAGVIGEAEIFVGVDTAAMHLASALQRPLVALFGPTQPFRWRPRHTDCRILVSGQPGVATRFSPNVEGREMVEIETISVIGAIDSLLSSSIGSP